MPSEEHFNLTKTIVDFFYRVYNPNNNKGWLLFCDHVANQWKPEPIQGFIPDFVAISNSHHIIGEAKTPKDLLSQRSQMQVSTFYESLSRESKIGIFVLCVQLNSIPDAKFLIKTLLKDERVKIHLLDAGGYEHGYLTSIRFD